MGLIYVIRNVSNTAGVLVVLICMSVASAQPISCTGNGITQRFIPTQLGNFDIDTLSFINESLLTPVATPNALGFNVLDGMIYGLVSGQQTPGFITGDVVRIDGSFGIANLGRPTAVDGATPWAVPFIPNGTMDSTGTYYNITNDGRMFALDIGGAGAPGSFEFDVITLTGDAPLAFGIADIVFNPVNSHLYGISGNQLLQISLAGNITRFSDTDLGLPLGTLSAGSGGSWYGGNGLMFFIGGGSLTRVDVTTTPFAVTNLGAIVSPPFGELDATSCVPPSITKAASPSQATGGDVVTYTFNISNPTESDILVDFQDMLPSGLSYVSGSLSPAMPGGGMVDTFTTDNLVINGITVPGPIGQLGFSVDVMVSASAPPGIIENQAQLDYSVFTFPSDDPNDPAVDDPTPITIIAADVAVNKVLNTTGPFFTNDLIEYTITVTNNGPNTATNVTVNDTPTNLTLIGVNSTNCSLPLPCIIPSLASGVSEVIMVTASIDGPGTFDNAVTVAATENDPDSGNNTDNTGNGGVAAAVADVAVTKILNTAGPFFTGDLIEYTITVTNNGPDTATNVTVTDTPTNLTLTGVNSTNCSLPLPCIIPSLASGASEVIMVTAIIDGPSAFNNAATVTATENDPDSGNNTDDTGNGGVAAAVADVAITKILNTPAPYVQGDILEYVITVTNNGPDTATMVSITDTPQNLTIIQVMSANCSAFPCVIPALANGQTEAISVAAMIETVGVFANSATASSDTNDPVDENNTSIADSGAMALPLSVPVPVLSLWWMLLLISLMLFALKIRS